MQCCCIIKPHRSTTYVIYVTAKIAWTSVAMVIAEYGEAGTVHATEWRKKV